MHDYMSVYINNDSMEDLYHTELSKLQKINISFSVRHSYNFMKSCISLEKSAGVDISGFVSFRIVRPLNLICEYQALTL